MLKRLVVSNFAIIENIDISFNNGLTVLTGETGAGKSLIIDSLNLLLGDRAQLEMIRTGFDKAEITGFFTITNIHLKAILDNLKIPYLGDEVKVYRVIGTSKSFIKVNDTLVTLQELKKIAKYLADIHMQFDTQKLLSSDNYLEIVDGFKYDLINEYLHAYKEALDDFKEKEKNYQSLVLKQKEINEKKDLYEYHLKEISSYNLTIDEENKIKEEIEYLKNFDKIYELLEECLELMNDDTLLDSLYNIKDLVNRLSEYQKNYIEIKDKLNDYYYDLESIFDNLKKDFKNLDYNPDELNKLEDRLNDLDNLKKKYHMSVIELIDYQQKLTEMLNINENYDDLINEAKNELKNSYNIALNKGLELTKIRKETGGLITKELEKNLSDLSLKARFMISFNEIIKEKDYQGLIFKENGLDTIDFLIETNIGEGLKPLSKTVSGGEMSRIMLALKAVFIKSQKISTVIFDEIDTGISGEVAHKVAMKIYEISLSTQVISITHLPQVASMSKTHLKISKTVLKDRTYTKVKELSLDEKIYEIALMISGGNVTESQLAYAKEMVMMK